MTLAWRGGGDYHACIPYESADVGLLLYIDVCIWVDGCDHDCMGVTVCVWD